MREVEHHIAVAFVSWWAYNATVRGLDQRVLFAIPNGGHRSPRTGARLKKEGVRAGIPDYMLAVPRGGFNGLFVELKSQVGTLSHSQREMFEILTRQGYNCVRARGLNEAIQAVVGYLGLVDNVSRETIA